MLFQSSSFLIFFIVFYTLFIFSFKKSPRLLPILILAGSYFFYSSWNVKYLPLIIVTTMIDFFFGLLIENEKEDHKRKVYLFISIALSASLLIFFKYINTIITSIHYFNFLDQVSYIPTSKINISIPVGLTFYTFQSMSYVIDIYRKKISAKSNFIDFATYVAFFPQLIAGPVMRSDEYFKFYYDLKVNLKNFYQGLALFSIGIFKKVLIADFLASSFVDQTFANIHHSKVLDIFMACIGFNFQVYYDFSGYTDMAMGIALAMGMTLPMNFNKPFLAPNIREYWHRWHITMSLWMRDYIYFSLGGNKVSAWRKQFNLAATLLFSALWHGINLNFLTMWVFTYVTLAISHLKNDYLKDKLPFQFPYTIQCLITFLILSVGRLFYRAPTFGELINVFSRALNGSEYQFSQALTNAYIFLVVLAVTQHLLSLYNVCEKFLGVYERAHPIIKISFAVGVIYLCSSIKSQYQPFIYFQF